MRDHQPYPEVHGERGLGHADLPAPLGSPSERSATALIVETARARPGEVLLVATGPLTNVAVALAEEPPLPDLLKGLAIKGGAFAKAGNVSPTAETNIWVDPEAAQAVFRAFVGAPQRSCRSAPGWTSPNGSACLVPMSRRSARPHRTRRSRGSWTTRSRSTSTPTSAFGPSEGASMHDPLALAIAIDPTFVELATTRVEVECDGRWTRGMSVTDLAGVRRRPWALGWDPQENARVALEVDADRFMAWFVGRLRDLVEARA